MPKYGMNAKLSGLADVATVHSAEGIDQAHCSHLKDQLSSAAG
jgi:hypothetical protein